ncbi:GPW/gp25 family protein [bacterium]|nr:GPW/gp25 family protein [bacterium]
MSIVLDFLKRSNSTPSANPDVSSIGTDAATSSNHVYRDIYLDLDTTSYFTTNRLDAKESAREIRTAIDEAAIVQSIRNILTTSPGQKLLNPRFGINIGDLLFDAVTLDRGQFIAEVISKELSRQERRAEFTNIHVVADPDAATYTVNITAVIPALSRRALNISGVITSTGLMIDRIDNNTIA